MWAVDKQIEIVWEKKESGVVGVVVINGESF